VAAIEVDQHRSADTHLWKFDVPALAGIDLYLKDESTRPTGSLKHRLARCRNKGCRRDCTAPGPA
jgi:cysteine synthase A